MPTQQEDFDRGQFEQLEEQLTYEERLSVQLGDGLAELQRRENVAQRILWEIAELAKGQPGHAGDQDKAKAALSRIADKKTILIRRIDQAKARAENTRAQMGRFDRSALTRIEKIRQLFAQLAYS